MLQSSEEEQGVPALEVLSSLMPKKEAMFAFFLFPRHFNE
jgi:hypothetical protein